MGMRGVLEDTAQWDRTKCRPTCKTGEKRMHLLRLVATKVAKRPGTKLGSSVYTLKNHITGTENGHISYISYELAVQTIVLGSKFAFP